MKFNFQNETLFEKVILLINRQSTALSPHQLIRPSVMTCMKTTKRFEIYKLRNHYLRSLPFELCSWSICCVCPVSGYAEPCYNIRLCCTDCRGSGCNLSCPQTASQSHCTALIADCARGLPLHSLLLGLCMETIMGLWPLIRSHWSCEPIMPCSLPTVHYRCWIPQFIYI